MGYDVYDIKQRLTLEQFLNHIDKKMYKMYEEKEKNHASQ